MQHFLASFSYCLFEVDLWNYLNLVSNYFKKPIRFIRFSDFTHANHLWQLNVSVDINYFPFPHVLLPQRYNKRLTDLVFSGLLRLGHKSAGQNSVRYLEYGP